MEPTIIIHTGVGSTPLTDKKKAKNLARLAIDAVDAGYQALESDVDRPALKAVEHAINVLEASGIVNAGIGAVMQSDGIQRRDASIMDGSTLACGSVSSLENVKHAISVARRLLEFTEAGEDVDPRWNFYFCGYHVDKIFEIHGESIPDEWKMEGTPSLVPREQQVPDGETVGAVAIDSSGIIVAGTSTGGLSGSYPGRIGDTPVIGAGTYANKFCGVSNTGRGENVMKLVAAKRVCDLVKSEECNAMIAVDRMIREYEQAFPGTSGHIGTIAIDKDGSWTSQFNGAAMTWAVKNSSAGFYGQRPGEKQEF
ncbi:MAG TPA: isoaspartyl peptidase/L-asparaginase [Candidatus Lokiarchaeia archaeon]|nr:isoaspartyl peptidase/L-asparaginase [Candidatus Lokiarchaeia archaeon]